MNAQIINVVLLLKDLSSVRENKEQANALFKRSALPINIINISMEEAMKMSGIIFAIMMTLLMSSQTPAQAENANVSVNEKSVKNQSSVSYIWSGYTEEAIERAHELYPLLDENFRGNLTAKEFEMIYSAIKNYFSNELLVKTGDDESKFSGYEHLVCDNDSRVSLLLYAAPFKILIEKTRVLPLIYPDYSYSLGLVSDGEKGEDKYIRISPHNLVTLITTRGNEDSIEFGQYLYENLDLSFFFPPSDSNEDLSFFFQR